MSVLGRLLAGGRLLPLSFQNGCRCTLRRSSLPVLSTDAFGALVFVRCYKKQSTFRLKYSGFSEGNKLTPRRTVYLYFVTLSLGFCLIFDVEKWMIEFPRRWFLGGQKSTKAAELTGVDGSGDDSGSDGDEAAAASGRKRVSFKNRKTIQYENRLRMFSTADKIFRYFATLRVANENSPGPGRWDYYMTPDDFVRAVTPGMIQPEGLGLDQFRTFDPDRDTVKTDLPKDGIFAQLTNDSLGLVSFSDFLFLMTLLSTAPRQFALAFRMFDLNGDGTVDFNEFKLIQEVVSTRSSLGKKHRDTMTNTFRAERSAISRSFFGERLDGLLTVQRFLQFQADVHRELLRLEFNKYDADASGRISDVDFCRLLLAFSKIPSHKRKKMLNRVRRAIKEEQLGVSFDECIAFDKVLQSLPDIETALTFHNIANASIDQATFKQVTNTVANVRLSDHLVGLIFLLFDENQDGELSNSEFIKVMKDRASRGLGKPREFGITRLFSGMWHCASQLVPERLSIASVSLS